MSNAITRPAWVHLAEKRRAEIRAQYARKPQAWIGRIEAAKRERGQS